MRRHSNKPFVGGFIMLGFPQTQEQIEKLKEIGIGFDKILCLQDMDEENPGALLKERKKDDEFYDLAYEMENSERLANVYKEQYEEIVADIGCNGSVEDVMARVYAAIDPFFVQVNNPENVRNSDEVGEEEKPLPKGEYGDFCPVTLTNDTWLYPGSDEHE
jgi:adenylate/nucleoside-diphosphate kinase